MAVCLRSLSLYFMMTHTLVQLGLVPLRWGVVSLPVADIPHHPEAENAAHLLTILMHNFIYLTNVLVLQI